MDDKNKGYRGGLYGPPEESDDYMPRLPDPKEDPLFAEKKEEPQPDGKLALMSLVFGVVGMLFICIWKAALLCGALGLTSGILARIRGRDDPNHKWKTPATVGIVLSVVAVCTVCLLLLLLKLGVLARGAIGGYFDAIDQGINQ